MHSPSITGCLCHNGWDTRWVPKEMLGLVEGGGLRTVAELVREYEEEEEQG